MKSVEIFKQIISNHIPDYKSSLDDAVFRDAKSFFTDSDSEIGDTQNISRAKSTVSYIFEADSEINEPSLKQQLQNKEIDLNEIIDEFLGDLAQLYLEEPNSSDPIILFLLYSNNLEFLKQLEFAKELKQAIRRIERQEKKEELKQLDEQEDEGVIRAAFQRIEREEKKKQLQDLEEAEKLKPTGSGFISYSANLELKDEYQFNQSVASKNQIPWKFVIRVAAILILVLIPVGISVLFFGDDETSTVIKGPKPKGGKTIIYAETGDLSELKRLDIPLPKIDDIISTIQNNKPSFGFAREEEKISISVIYKGNQIDYLDQKIILIENKIKELKAKNIKDKEATLTSLSEISSKCKLDKKALELKDLTYEFDSKNFKLTVYTKNKIDPKKLKVYSIKNDDESLSYFLKLFDNYYSLSKSKGSLGVVTNQELLDELEEID